MKLNKWIQIILVGSSILTLAACAHRSANNSGVNAANASYRGAHASGYGHESGFGEEGRAHLASSKNLYYFDYDSYTVRPNDKAMIAANAEYLMSHPNKKVMLEGHTDPRGSREYNVGLGERRARAVASEFTSKGVKPSQMVLVSYGSQKLASQGRSEEDFQKDRRAALVFAKK